MKKLYPLILCIFYNYVAYAQKAKDVLEDGIPVAKNENIFLKPSGDVLKYFIGEAATRPLTMKDSIIFLIKNSSVNIYLKPINPLNYSFSTEMKIVLDQISKDESDVLKAVTDLGSKFSSATAAGRSMLTVQKDDKTGCDHNDLEATWTSIKESLKDSKKANIVDEFKALKKLTFVDEVETREELSKIAERIKKIDDHFTKVDSSIKSFRKDIIKFDCANGDNPFIVRYVFDQLATELQGIKTEQFKRVKNLRKVFDIVEKARKDASEDKDGLRWCYFLDEVPADKGKISIFTVTINTAGFRLSTADDKETENDEIIVDQTKQKIKKTLKIRRFQRFVPEVSTGVVYTNLSFPDYGTRTDSVTGKQYVTEAGADIIKKVNVTAMLNYNYFLQNSPIHPFVQVGVGANVDFPTLLLGGGLRFNGNGGGRFAFSAGLASSWIKTLDKLVPEVSVITGTADLEKDIKYQFATPKIYFGIQYSF